MANEQRELPMDMGPTGGTNWPDLHAKAVKVFHHTTPVAVRDVFAGRQAEITRICDVVMQPGQHAILFGERGVGKTSLANVLSGYLRLTDEEQEVVTPLVSPRINCDREDTFDSVWRKVLDRIPLSSSYQPVGFGAEEEDEEITAMAVLPEEYRIGVVGARAIDPDAVRKLLNRIGKRSVLLLVIDEFDRLADEPRRAFADLIKMLSDYDVPVTVVLVGVADTIDGLLSDHQSVSRALVQVHMRRMAGDEIAEILTSGAGKLGMTITLEAVRRITAIARGLPYYAHLVGLHASRTAIEAESLDITSDQVHEGIRRAVRDTHHSTVKAYEDAVRSAHKDNLFADVLLACALAKCDALGYFAARDVREPLRAISSKQYDIPSFSPHLSDFSSERRGPVLEAHGPSRRIRYRFKDPLMQPYVTMQGQVSGRLPESLLREPW